MAGKTMGFQAGLELGMARGGKGSAGRLASLMGWCLRRAKDDLAQLAPVTKGMDLQRVDVPFLVRLGRNAA